MIDIITDLTDLIIFLSYAIYIVFVILTIYKGFVYSKDNLSFLKGLYKFISYLIIVLFVGIIFFIGNISLFGFVFGVGNEDVRVPVALVNTSLLIYWYGLLEFKERKNIILSTQGLIFAIIIALIGVFIDRKFYDLGHYFITIGVFIPLFYPILRMRGMGIIGNARKKSGEMVILEESKKEIDSQ